MEQIAVVNVELLMDRRVEKVRVNLVKGDQVFGFLRPLKPKPKIVK